MPPSPPTKPSAAPAVLAGLGLLVCCFPAGLLGAGLGYKQMRDAKAAGQPSPSGAVAAMVLGVLSVLVSAGVITLYKLDKRAGQAQAAAALRKAEQAREAEALDSQTACALAEAWLLAHRGVGAAEVTCKGALRPGTVAQLSGVSLKRSGQMSTFNVCLARQKRWFVLGVATLGDCPAAAPTVKDPGQGVDAYEEAIAQAAKPALRDSSVKAFEVATAQVVHAIDEAAEAPARCPSLPKQEVAIIDASLLDQRQVRTESASWRFTSTESVHTALDADERSEGRAEAVASAASLMRPYAVVLDAADRAMPKRMSAGKFAGGFIEGRLHVVDTEHHRTLCTAPLVAESSKEISSRKVGLKFGPKVTLGGDLEKDFAANYAQAVVTTLAKVTDGQLSVRF